MTNIIDAIVTNSYGIDHFYLVLDKMPEFLFERQGSKLISECDGFHCCYGYETPSERWKAFGGMKFEIPMKDGTTIEATGQWWAISPLGSQVRGEFVSVGIATLEMLKKCYVFNAGIIENKKLTEWLSDNEPSTDYYKYDERRKATGATQ